MKPARRILPCLAALASGLLILSCANGSAATGGGANTGPVTLAALKKSPLEIVSEADNLRLKLDVDEKGALNLLYADGKGGWTTLAGDIVAKAKFEAQTPERIIMLTKHIQEVAARKEHDAAEVTVQHILVSFKGAPQVKQSRSLKEAAALAGALLERIGKGEDFDALVKEHTDDSHPGIYKMALKGGNPGQGAYPRGSMTKLFGDVAWRLDVGQVGVTDYDQNGSPFGYHIIKRLQ